MPGNGPTTAAAMSGVGIDDVRQAMARIRPHVHRTPVLTSESLSRMAGADLFFKCENLQRIGAFKTRGAFNAVLTMPAADRGAGVVTHSSGNHGAALALAARETGTPAWVVVPDTAPAIKRAAIERLGATIVACGAELDDRERVMLEVQARTGARFVPPYNDVRIIAGQGTAALELLEDVQGLDAIWVPVGGGGLAAGTAIAAGNLGIPVVGAEPELADDARRSLESGVLQPALAPRTIADGLRTSLGPLTFAVLQRFDVAVHLASDAEIRSAMGLLMERLKLVVEPSAAVPLAAMLRLGPQRAAGVIPSRATDRALRIGVILSGGNIDVAPLIAALE